MCPTFFNNIKRWGTINAIANILIDLSGKYGYIMYSKFLKGFINKG